MIESIEFRNFKVLRNTTLPLAPCSILVGANGSGKTTVLEALEVVRDPPKGEVARFLSVGLKEDEEPTVALKLNWTLPGGPTQFVVEQKREARLRYEFVFADEIERQFRPLATRDVYQSRNFSFDARAIASPSPLSGELGNDGSGLAGLLFRLRDTHLEHFQSITAEFGRCLPEFDRILFREAEDDTKEIALRTREGQHRIGAADLSQGTLIALALVTLANLPAPPSVIGLEEPDRGIHPRLLRRMKDALYRLSHPESCGEKREPVQVIATTHSPYMLDLFKEHPEEVVICEKVGLEVQFRRLSDLPNIEEIIGDAPLGEAWHTGVLGGVPSEP